VESEVDRGTRVDVYLPGCQGSLTHESSAGGDPAKTFRGRGERLLLVEDDQRIRVLCVTVLERAGYRVEASPRAEEALALFESGPDDFPLLISDVVMPGMSGIELAKRVIALRPATKVLCISGYAPETALKRAVEEGDVEFLPKPFSPGDILRRVHEMLADRP